MDPYLEHPLRWGEVHTRLIVAISTELNKQLPEGLNAEIDQYVTIAEDRDEESFSSRRNPDVFIPDRYGYEPPVLKNGSAVAVAVAVLEAPTTETVLLSGEIVKHRRILIQTNDGKKILTAIELLSPSNKDGGKDQDSYLAKRNQYLASGTNLVEIDLLRAGVRLPFGYPSPPSADYYILVSAAVRRPKTSVWALTMRQRIPVVGVPLNEKWSDVPLDLRSCLQKIYDEGRFGNKADYTKPAVPPLNQPDAEWAASFLPKPAKKKKG